MRNCPNSDLVHTPMGPFAVVITRHRCPCINLNTLDIGQNTNCAVAPPDLSTSLCEAATYEQGALDLVTY